MAHKVVIYFRCKWEDIHKIQERFKLPTCVNVNGETCQPVDISDDDWALLQETERRGYIQIRNKKVTL